MNAIEYIDFCKNIILKLRNFDNTFEKICVWNTNTHKDFIFMNDLSNFNIENLKLIIIEDKEIAYLNSNNENKNLTNESKSWLGFSSAFAFGNNEGSLSVSQGAYKELPAKIEFKFGDSFQSKLTEQYITELIELISCNAKIKFANAISGDFFLKVRQKNKHSIGWINYTDRKDFYKVLSKENAYSYLNVANGVIFSISKIRPNSNDDNLVNRAISLSNLLK